jgi:hypothetical protein
MSDDQPRRLAAAIERIAGPASWFVRVVTRAAGLALVPAVIVWWVGAADGLGDWWRGTLASILALVLLALPALWLVNVRLAVTSLLALPDALEDVATRRVGEVRSRGIERPRGGLLGTMRTIRSVAQDYGTIVGGWGLVVQLVTPWFWLLTAVALAAVPVLWLAALVTLGVAAV